MSVDNKLIILDTVDKALLAKTPSSKARKGPVVSPSVQNRVPIVDRLRYTPLPVEASSSTPPGKSTKAKDTGVVKERPKRPKRPTAAERKAQANAEKKVQVNAEKPKKQTAAEKKAQANPAGKLAYFLSADKKLIILAAGRSQQPYKSTSVVDSNDDLSDPPAE